MREWASAHNPIHQNISIASFIIQKQAYLASFPKFSLPLHLKITKKEMTMENEEKGQCPCCGSDDVQPCDDGTFICMHCGEGKTGVVMSGVFDSNPYPSEDWSGKGRRTYYVDLKPNFIADPERATIITTEKLDEAIGWFDWHGGHSGTFLYEDAEMKLEELLADYFKKIHRYVDKKTINGFYLPQDIEA